MRSYLTSIRYFLFSSIGFSFLTGTQTILGLYNNRIVQVIFFGVFFVGYITVVILLIMDLIIKDTRIMNVRVISVNQEIIKVLKPNGKKRSITKLRSEINKYHVKQELELTLTRRTRQIMAINSLQSDNSASNTDFNDETAKNKGNS